MRTNVSKSCTLFVSQSPIVERLFLGHSNGLFVIEKFVGLLSHLLFFEFAVLVQKRFEGGFAEAHGGKNYKMQSKNQPGSFSSLITFHE